MNDRNQVLRSHTQGLRNGNELKINKVYFILLLFYLRVSESLGHERATFMSFNQP